MKTGRERLEDLKKKINKEIDKWDNHVKRVKEKVSKRM